MIGQLGVGVVGHEPEVAAATLWVEAGGHSDGFDQGRLPAAVVTTDHGDRPELQSIDAANCGQVEGIAGPIVEVRLTVAEGDGAQVRGWLHQRSVRDGAGPPGPAPVVVVVGCDR